MACAIGLGLKTYWVWKAGPWDLPSPAKPKPLALTQTPDSKGKPVQPIAGTEIIVSKNLFDPERGASRTKEAEADIRAMQRIRGMVLLGTAILGSNRYAVIQESDGTPNAGPAAQGRPQTLRRLKPGDMVEGFNLSEIGEKKVVFVKGAARVEVPIDFFRKVDIAGPPGIAPAAQVGTPGPGGPPVNPNITRRPRLPSPPSP